MPTKRALVWEDTLVDTDLASAASPTVLGLLLGMSDGDKRASTITRVLVRLSFTEAVLNSGTAVQNVQVGMGIASQEAFALGETAIPDINVAGDRPRLGWYYRDEVVVASSTADTANVIHIATLRADIGAMRWLENGEFYLTMRNGAMIGLAFAVNVKGLIRTLVRLP